MKKIIQNAIIYEHIIETMRDGVLTIDNEGVFQTVNLAAAEILAIPREKLQNGKLLDIFFEQADNDDLIQIILDAVYDSSMSHNRICNYNVGGISKVLFVTTSLLKQETEGVEKSFGITVLLSDITELRELQDAAIAFEKIHATNQKLERLSYLDELTSLPNRRYFKKVCFSEWRKKSNHGKPMAVMMIDLDYFKQINDSRGHQVGDICLSQVGKVLSDSMRRDSDLVARYGGDEFIAFLPDTDIEEGSKLGDAICQNIRNLNFVNEQSPYGQLTVSIGVASFVASADADWKESARIVDEALYRAKEKGRNQISI